MDVLGMLDLPLWLLLTVALLITVYTYTTWTYSTWSRLGIPGPKPRFLSGNSREVIQKSMLGAVEDWKRQYGRVFGLYFGRSAILIVSDLDIVREVLVKEFNNFCDRFFVSGGTRPAVVDKGLFFVGAPAWKRIRALMTPAFTASKLKSMCHYIDRCCRILEDTLEGKTRREEPLDVKAMFGAFTLDVIAGTAFGVETNSQTREDDPFIVNCRKFFGKLNAGGSGWVLRIVGFFPFLAPLVQTLGLTVFAEKEADFFLQSVYEMVDERRRKSIDDKSQRRTDFLQLLVDAEANSDDQIADRPESYDQAKSYKRMTREEVVGQGFVILMAGYETTSTTLQYLAYNLALHPDVQQRVYEEIRDTIGDEAPTYEHMAGLKYLDSVIHETLRLFPPVSMINRRALKTTTVRGVTIPAGCGVHIPIHSIMHDPDFFDDPDRFSPDRFSEENRSRLDPLLVELVFGFGPRQCIGMRLALIEIKFAAVRVIRRFRLLPADNMPTYSQLKEPGLRAAAKVIKLRTQERV